MDNVPDATLEQSEALDVSSEVLLTPLKSNTAVDNNVLTEPSDDVAVVPDVSEYISLEKPAQVVETEATAATVKANIINDSLGPDTSSQGVKDEGTKTSDAPSPSEITSVVAATEVVDDGGNADVLVQADSADDTRVPDIVNLTFDQHTEHEAVEVISSTLKEATAIPIEAEDTETKSSSVDNSQVAEHNPSEGINEEKAIVDGTIVENVAKDHKTAKHPTPLIDTAPEEPMFMLTPPTPHTHTPTFITPPDPPDDEGPPPSSDMVTDLVNSLLYPGHTPSGVIHLMDFAFFALFATLAGMLALTGGNLHVILMLVLSLVIYGSIKWFIIELDKLNEEELAALKTKKDN